jgi:ABC-2 type transport system ATP-binding protein
VIRAQRERGATVFLNSHLLSEVEITCDEVAFIKDGEVIAKRDLRESPQGEIRVVVRGKNFSTEMVGGLKKWTASAQIEGELLTLTTRSTDVLPDVLRHIVAAGADVYEFKPERLSLEDLFVRIMGEDRGL